MKNKLRKIVVNGIVYLWRVDEKFIGVEKRPGQYTATVKAIIFKEGLKGTPLTVVFDVMEDVYVGTRITSSNNDMNLHKPSNIRIFIEEGLDRGWLPEKSALIIENGLEVYESHGFSVSDV